MSGPYTIKAGETYVIELDHPLSPEEMETMRKQWQEATGAKVILLSDAKMVRTATDADEIIQRVRALHAPFNSYCSGCLDPYCKGETVVCGECGESFYPYPCDTIKALDGDQS